MPSKIQRIPSALLAALGIKGTGFNPTTLTDEVVPVIDVTENYASQFLQVITDTAVVNGAGAGVSLSVPDGQLWRVYGVSAEFLPNGGDLVQLIAQIRASGIGTSFRCFAAPETHVAVAGERTTIGGLLPKPLILPSGSIVRAQLGPATGGIAATIRANALVEQLGI